MDRFEAGVADDLADLLFGCGVWAFGLQDAAGVVAAEAQANLEDFEALGLEVGLNVGDVVEVHAGDGKGLEIFDCCCFFEAGERIAVRREGPGREGAESSGFFL